MKVIAKTEHGYLAEFSNQEMQDFLDEKDNWENDAFLNENFKIDNIVAAYKKIKSLDSQIKNSIKELDKAKNALEESLDLQRAIQAAEKVVTSAKKA